MNLNQIIYTIVTVIALISAVIIDDSVKKLLMLIIAITAVNQFSIDRLEERLEKSKVIRK